MRILSLFTGIGGLEIGIKSVVPEARVVGSVEADRYCQRLLLARMADGLLDPGPLFGDIRAFDGRPWRGSVDLICGGFPCFVAGTLILTWGGYRPIETLVVGDRVLTHRGRWRPVTAVMQRKSTETRIVRAQGCPAIQTTAEHPFYVRVRGRRWDNSVRLWRRTFSEPAWRDAGRLDNSCYAGQVLPVEPVGAGKEDEHFWWVVGRYLADGWRARGNGKGRVVICASHGEADGVEARISRVFPCCRSEERTVVKFHITRIGFYDWLEQFGKGAGGKLIPGWVFGLSSERACALLDGYLSGDGSRYRNSKGEGGGWKATTVSKALALGVGLLAQRAWGVVASVSECSVPDWTVIEGRQVRQQRQYHVGIPDRNRSAFVDGEYGWKLVRSVESAGAAVVWNIAVAEDESYVADGAIVHNCQGISNAGRRQGMADPRSGLWHEFARIIGEVGPGYVFVENVAALVNRGLDTVLGSLGQLGYDAEWGVFSAAEVGAPHLRKRLFILAHRRGERLEGDGEAGTATRTTGRGSGAALADPQILGRELRPAEGGRSGRPASGRSFPPGPADTAAWERVLEQRPDLCPALEAPERALRGVDDGRARRLERLRALGNAVVPATAALAFAELWERMEGGSG